MKLKFIKTLNENVQSQVLNEADIDTRRDKEAQQAAAEKDEKIKAAYRNEVINYVKQCCDAINSANKGISATFTDNNRISLSVNKNTIIVNTKWPSDQIAETINNAAKNAWANGTSLDEFKNDQTVVKMMDEAANEIVTAANNSLIQKLQGIFTSDNLKVSNEAYTLNEAGFKDLLKGVINKFVKQAEADANAKADPNNSSQSEESEDNKLISADAEQRAKDNAENYSKALKDFWTEFQERVYNEISSKKLKINGTAIDVDWKSANPTEVGFSLEGKLANDVVVVEYVLTPADGKDDYKRSYFASNIEYIGGEEKAFQGHPADLVGDWAEAITGKDIPAFKSKAADIVTVRANKQAEIEAQKQKEIAAQQAQEKVTADWVNKVKGYAKNIKNKSLQQAILKDLNVKQEDFTNPTILGKYRNWLSLCVEAKDLQEVADIITKTEFGSLDDESYSYVTTFIKNNAENLEAVAKELEEVKSTKDFKNLGVKVDEPKSDSDDAEKEKVDDTEDKSAEDAAAKKSGKILSVDAVRKIWGKESAEFKMFFTAKEDPTKKSGWSYTPTDFTKKLRAYIRTNKSKF